MREAELFCTFTGPLEQAGIDHMVGGSVAGMVYGEPRLTNDIDIVVDLDAREAPGFAAAFPEDDFYLPPLDVIMIESQRRTRGHFNLIHHTTGYKADIYLRGRDLLHDWAFPRRKRIPLGTGSSLWVAPPEYIITRKLEYFSEGGSEKHIDDIQGILAASSSLIDQDALASWIVKLGLSDAWQVVTKSAGQ